MTKYLKSEEKIKKQKKENEKKISEKFLELAIKREDTCKNLIRHERQQELERQKKLNFIDKRNERWIELQKQKDEINFQKKILSQNVSKRKIELLKKVRNILTSGNFQSKDDIYKKVFNDEELDMFMDVKHKKLINKNIKIKSEDYGNDFFLTQNGTKNNDKNNQEKDIEEKK